MLCSLSEDLGKLVLAQHSWHWNKTIISMTARKGIYLDLSINKDKDLPWEQEQVHGDSELCSPLCEGKGEHGVQSHGGHGHGGVGVGGAGPLHDGDLQEGRDNIEHQAESGDITVVLSEHDLLMVTLISIFVVVLSPEI